MPQNDNLLDDGIIDSLDLKEGISSENTYVPKFERDLANAGSLEALSAAKKSEKEKKDKESEVITKDENAKDNTEHAESSEDETQEFEDEAYIDVNTYNSALTAENEDNPHYQLHTKSNTNENRPAAKSIMDFAREAEEVEREKKEVEKKNFFKSGMDEIDVTTAASMLTEMDYDSKKDKSHSLRQQMQLDDLAMEMDNKPQIEDMSEQYAPSKKNADDLISKDMLDREEKQIIKEHLESEISKNPEGFNKRASTEMYRKLMLEQKAKRSKKGFAFVVMLFILGLVVAGLTYFMLDWDELTRSFGIGSQVGLWLGYVPYLTAAFSLIMLLKSKTLRIFSLLYFIINTVILVVPGFVKFAVNTDCEPSHYIITIVFYVVTILLSAYISTQLCVNENVKIYYTSNIKAERKKLLSSTKPTVRRK